MEDARKNHNVLLTVIGVTTLLVAMVGATFAYFSATSESTEQNIKTGVLKVSATSSEKNNTNIKPTTWDGEEESEIADNKDVAVITLNVDTSQTTIEDATYNIFLNATGIKLNTGDDESLTGRNLSDIKWALFDESNKIGEGNFGEASADDTGNVTNLKVNNQGENIKITSGDDTQKYNLYIWIAESHNEQNQLQNLDINATLRVDAKYGL